MSRQHKFPKACTYVDRTTGKRCGAKIPWQPRHHFRPRCHDHGAIKFKPNPNGRVKVTRVDPIEVRALMAATPSQRDANLTLGKPDRVAR